MRYLVFTLICLVIGCYQNKEKNIRVNSGADSLSISDSIEISFDKFSRLTCDLDTFVQASYNFSPRNTSFNKAVGELLKHIDMCCLINNLSSNDIDIFIESVDVIILKQHLFWLKNNNQGYDIYSMHGHQGKCLIDFYLRNLNIVIEGDPFLNSGFRSEQYLNNRSIIKNETIRQLLIEIDAEQIRINSRN